MFDVSAKNLRDEVESAAIPVRKKHTDCSARLIKRYAGDAYREDWKGSDSASTHEAHEFEFQVNMVPSLIHTNPAVQVKGLLSGIDDEVKEALEGAFPQWIEAINFAQIMQPVAYDIGFDFGVVMVGISVVPGYDSMPEPKPLWPMIWRVSARRFFMDPQASSFETARYMGHSWVQDKQDLIDAKGPDGQPTFNAAAVNEMAVDTDEDEGRASVEKDPTSRKVKRNQVVGYEIWVRETNTIYTVGTSTSGAGNTYLRDPRPYEGCAETGPYVLFGAYIVPDQLYPLPALAVTSGLVDELNAHREQASEDAKNAKRMVLVDAQNKQAKAAVVNGTSGTVVSVPGLAAGGVKEIEIGGPAKENIAYIAHLQEHLDRVSGLTETIRGNITGATASETDLAAQSADTRTRYLRSRVQAGVKAVFKAAAHFFVFNDQVNFWVSSTDPATGQKIAKQFEGGLIEQPHMGETLDPQTGQYVPVMMPPQDPASYQRLNIDIEPYSMEMVDQGVLQRRIMGVADFLGQFGPTMPMNPHINWENIIDDMGEASNMKDAGKRYLNVGVLQGQQVQIVQQQQMAMAGQQQALMAGPGGAPPPNGARAGGPPGKREPVGAA